MGIASWAAASSAALVIARIVPWGRDRRWLPEIVTVLLAGGACGLIATAMDFGGWQEPDWRAALFVLLGAFAAVGVVRGTR